jgi:hypothetical protein
MAEGVQSGPERSRARSLRRSEPLTARTDLSPFRQEGKGAVARDFWSCLRSSSAPKLLGIPPNTSFIAFGVVPSLCSSSTSPPSSNTQYQLDRSPRSKPIVSCCSRKFLVCLASTVLIFFIAGLLYLLRFERVDNLGAYRIPPETGILIPSVNVTRTEC